MLIQKHLLAALSSLVLVLPLLSAQQPKQTFLYSIVKDGKWGFIDQTGRVVIKPQFDNAFDFQDGLARVTEHGKVAFVDPTGKVVLRPEFQIVEDFSEGLAAVNNGLKRDPHIGLVIEPGRWGYIDKTGQLAIPMTLTHAEAFSEGLAAAELNNRTGFIDRTGKMLFEVPLDVTMDFHEGVVAVLFKGGVTYFNNRGEKLDTPPLDPGPSYHSFAEGLATIETKGKSGYIDKTGKLVIPAEFIDADDFSEGLAAVQMPVELTWCPLDKDGSRYGSSKRFGYIDKTGKVVIPPQFEYAGPFREGLANVSTCSKSGFIDRTGKMVMSVDYDDVFPFRGGLSQVRTRGDVHFGYIDKAGKIVWAPSK